MSRDLRVLREDHFLQRGLYQLQKILNKWKYYSLIIWKQESDVFKKRNSSKNKGAFFSVYKRVPAHGFKSNCLTATIQVTTKVLVHVTPEPPVLSGNAPITAALLSIPQASHVVSPMHCNAFWSVYMSNVWEGLISRQAGHSNVS